MIKRSNLILATLLSILVSGQPMAVAQDEQDEAAADNEVQDEADPTLETPQDVPGPVASSDEPVPQTATVAPEDEPIPEPESPTTIPETRSRRKPSTLFALGIGKPQEIGEYNHYEKIYGKIETIKQVQMGYFFYSYFIDVGVSAKFGYFNASGHPLKSLSSGTDRLETPLKRDIPDNFATDPNQKVELTLIPVQTLLELAYSPFPVSRRIVLRGYIGPEFLYVQETLKPNIPSTASVPTGTQLVSKGWNRGLVTGAMISISLNGIEARSDFALKSIGVDRTYISPFYEIVKTTNDKFGNYDRKIYGISLQLEGLR